MSKNDVEASCSDKTIQRWETHKIDADNQLGFPCTTFHLSSIACLVLRHGATLLRRRRATICSWLTVDRRTTTHAGERRRITSRSAGVDRRRSSHHLRRRCAILALGERTGSVNGVTRRVGTRVARWLIHGET
jgi:hypothetical protein